MIRRFATLSMACVALGATRQAGAQVGYPPHQSPFRDLSETMELSFYSGYYRAKKDPARVAPRSGPMIGARYQWRASGPANLTVDLGRVESERRVLDPEKTGTCAIAEESCKSAGVYRWPLYTLDGGLALSLTGARTFFKMVPEVRGGAGIVTDFHSSPDVGAFAFGTRFAFSWGAGVRLVPGGSYQFRADITNRLYSVKYPVNYYIPADDNTTILSGLQSRTAWLNNPAFTIGFSYLFSR